MLTFLFIFIWFRLHDFDKNHRLDGLELIAALSHVLPLDVTDEDNEDEKKRKIKQWREAMKFFIGEYKFKNYIKNIGKNVFEG